MQRRRNKKGLALVEYAIGLGAVASAAFVAFNYLGFATGSIVSDLTDCFRIGCGYVNVPCSQKWSCRDPFSCNI